MLAYWLNPAKNRIHVRIDGMSDERCNLDDTKELHEINTTEELARLINEMQATMCRRCERRVNKQ